MNPELKTQTKNKEAYTSIYISKQTRKVLGRIKLEHDLKSYDEVIRMLLRRAGYAD
jgi:hypothetical protein